MSDIIQYVGARYVPLFADPTEWNSSNTYEPLTIVTYMNASYTSRKQVPAGIEPTNNEYWALTGNYNAQVEQYRQTVEEYKEIVDSFPEDSTNFKKDFFIIIADSYGVTTTTRTPWTTYLENMLDLTVAKNAEGVTASTNCFELARGGQGFVGTPTYGNWLASLQSDFPSNIDKSKITKILIVGGYNDQYSTSDEIISAMNVFANYVDTNFPNAHVYTCCVGQNTEDISLNTPIMYAYNAYSTFNHKNWSYLAGLEGILHNQALMEDDNHHPNSSGGVKLAIALRDALTGSGSHVLFARNLITPADNVTIANPVTLYSEPLGRYIRAYLHRTLDITFTTPIFTSATMNRVAIGTLDSPSYYYGNGNIVDAVEIPIMAMDNSNVWYSDTARLLITYDGNISLWSEIAVERNHTNIKRIIIPGKLEFTEDIYYN